MFGYVRIDKGELKVKEYEAYRGIYCSLCRALSKRYGLFSRLILSYDMTFLAMVRFPKTVYYLRFVQGAVRSTHPNCATTAATGKSSSILFVLLQF